MFEIESSKLARERADQAGKTFAARTIKDHTEISDELKALVSSGKVKASLPAALDAAERRESPEESPREVDLWHHGHTGRGISSFQSVPHRFSLMCD